MMSKKPPGDNGQTKPRLFMIILKLTPKMLMLFDDT